MIPVKVALNDFYGLIVRRLPLPLQLRMTYLQCHRRWPNLRRPSRFSELCQLIKFAGDHLAPFVDKIEVKDFIRQTVGDQYLIPTLFAGSQLPARQERNWPTPFIIKTTHTSGGNIFVRENPDWPLIEQHLADLLAFDYAKAHHEQFYSAVPPRVLVEPMLGSGNMPDFKIFTFGGKPEAIQVDTDRHTSHKRSFYDCSWNRLNIRVHYPVDERPIAKPAQLYTMLEIASELSRKFPFVRVDLYHVDGHVFFGELTFCPGAGYERFEPSDIDERWGKLWLDAQKQMAALDCGEFCGEFCGEGTTRI